MVFGNMVFAVIDYGFKAVGEVFKPTVSSNADKAWDGLAVDQQVKEVYKGVEPAFVKQAYDRFGKKMLLEVSDLSSRAVAEIDKKYIVNGYVEKTIDTGLRNIALRAVSWASDKIKATLPDAQAKKDFATDIAVELNDSLKMIQSASDKVHSSGISWESPHFQKSLAAALAASSFGKEVESKEVFYGKIADRLIARLEVDLHQAGVLPDWMIALNGVLKSVKPELAHDVVRDGLILMHQAITDPERLKGWTAEILNSISGSLESGYKLYDHSLESPQSNTPRADFDPVHGQAIMALLRTLRPSALGLDILSNYDWLMAKQLPSGRDLLTGIIAEPTQKSILELMSSHTDQWMVGSIKLAAEKLLHPAVIPALATHTVTPLNQATTAVATTPLVKPRSVTSEAWEAMSPAQKQVSAGFVDSTKRIARNALRAGLIFEVYLPTLRQVALESKRSWPVRIAAGLGAFIVGFPILSIVFEGLHRLVNWLRAAIADSAGNKTGEVLATRCDELFHSPAIDYLMMHLLQHSFEKLELLMPLPLATAAPANPMTPTSSLPTSPSAASLSSEGLLPASASTTSLSTASPLPASASTTSLSPASPSPANPLQ